MTISIGPPPAKGTKDEANTFWRASREVLTLAGPTTLIAGLLYYFGYVSTKAYYAYFGVSVSALDLSFTAYLVRSADTVFRPLATTLIVVILFFAIHQVLSLLFAKASLPWRRSAATAFGVAGVILAGIGVLGLYDPREGVLAPLSLAASGLALEYAAWTAVTYAALPVWAKTALTTGRDSRRGLIAAFVLVAIFWVVTNLAYTRGTVAARLVEQSLPIQPQAVVYSAKDLQLPGDAVHAKRLTSARSAYQFRYNGLRPLIYSAGRWFLLPVDWTHTNGSTVIVLQDDAAHLRVDLAPPVLPVAETAS